MKFAAVFGQRDPVPRKPDFGMSIEIARILNLKPYEIIYLEIPILIWKLQLW